MNASTRHGGLARTALVTQATARGQAARWECRSRYFATNVRFTTTARAARSRCHRRSAPGRRAGGCRAPRSSLASPRGGTFPRRPQRRCATVKWELEHRKPAGRAPSGKARAHSRMADAGALPAPQAIEDARQRLLLAPLDAVGRWERDRGGEQVPDGSNPRSAVTWALKLRARASSPPITSTHVTATWLATIKRAHHGDPATSRSLSRAALPSPSERAISRRRTCNSGSTHRTPVS